jgi:hypothetical protein
LRKAFSFSQIFRKIAMRKFLTFLIALGAVALGVCSPASSQGLMMMGAGSVAAPHATAGGVAFDQVSNGTPANNTAGPASWTHTPVGTPTAVAVLVDGFSLPVDPTVTYGGTSLGTYTVKKFNGTDTVYIYCLPNPPSGAQTVNVSWTGGNAYVTAFAITVTNSNTSSCFSNTAGASGTSNSISNTVTSATGQLVVDIADQDPGGTLTAGGGQSNTSTSNVSGLHSSVSTAPGSASVTMTWASTSSADWADAAASFH